MIITDDFSRDLSKWQINSGTWTVTSGELIGSGNPGNSIVLRNFSAISDATISVDMKFTGGVAQQQAIFARASSASSPFSNCYLAILDSAQQRLCIGKRVNDTTTILLYKSYAVSLNVYYRLTFELSGNTLKVSINDNPASVIQAQDSTFTSGSCGFVIVGTSTARYDNFIIEAHTGIIELSDDAGLMVSDKYNSGFQLDLGQIVAGNQSNIKKIYLANGTSLSLSNVIVWLENIPQADIIEISKTDNPFISSQQINFDGTFPPDSNIGTFYVRVKPGEDSSGAKSFRIKVSAIPV